MTPESLRAVFPQTHWQLGKLWALDLRVEPVEVADLVWMFDLPLWQLNGERFKVTPNQVAATPMNFRPHYERVMDADLDFPIHLVAYRGRLVVLDGVHRLLKAHFLRRRWIEAKIATARFYGEQILPSALGLVDSVKATSEGLFTIPDADLAR